MGRLTHTVSGGIASFRTPSKVPIESLKFHFLPKQAAGTPSPENPIPIEGWTGLNGKRAGKNLIEPHYGVETEQRGLTITPSVNGISVSGTASARTAVFLSKTNKNTKLGVGDKVTFSLYLNGDISECELPFLGYYKSPSVWGAVIGQLSSENNRKITWTVPNTYTDDSLLDSYIYVPQGVTVNFEIGLQMEKGTNATAYKPYFEEQIPITFPSNGKNLFDKSTLGIELQPYNLRLARNSGHGNPFLLRKGFTYTFSCNSETRPNEIRIMIPYTANSIKYVYDTYYTTYTPSEDMYVGLNFYWTNGRPEDATDFQIELGSARTSYEPYSSDNTIYGGYIDPVAGEIVATFKKINLKNKAWYYYTSNQFALTTDKKLLSEKVFCDMLPVSKINGYPTDDKSIGFWGNGQSYANIIFIKYEASNDVNDFKTWLNSLESDPCLIYEFDTPIHIPIAAQDMKAFLDHNNFWSDANDITEVTYPITESKDILATRKKAMAFDHAHHKKVKWNQICKYGDFQNAKDWLATSGYGSLSVDNGVMTWTALQVPTQYYQTGFSHSKIYIEVPYNHKVLAMAKVKTSCSAANLQARLYGMVGSNGGANTYSYNTYISGNDWIDVKGFIRDRPEIPPTGIDDTIIKKFKILLALANGGSYEGIIDIGSTLQAKNYMVFDLTQMFGLGNEPQTVAEFEHICEINGIDLTTYQPYDTGSDRWLIVP